jgi:DNA replication regulator DPB11
VCFAFFVTIISAQSVLLGANLASNFSQRSTHLLCPSFTGAKYDKAIEWGVPVVDMTWLEAVAKTGAFPLSTEPSAGVELPRPSGVQNKGKEREVNPETSITVTKNGTGIIYISSCVSYDYWS